MNQGKEREILKELTDSYLYKDILSMEDDGDGYQDMILGTFSQNGDTVTLTIDSDLVATCYISGNTLVACGGYLGSMVMTKTDKFSNAIYQRRKRKG